MTNNTNKNYLNCETDKKFDVLHQFITFIFKQVFLMEINDWLFMFMFIICDRTKVVADFYGTEMVANVA